LNKINGASIFEKETKQEEDTQRSLKIEEEKINKAKKREELSSDSRWKEIQKKIKSEFGEKNWKGLFSKLQLENISDAVITFGVPTKFIRDWILREFIEKDKQLLSLINQTMREVKSIKVILIES
jgi:hypothetical protein